jgi:uncharacterized membrane protein
MTMRWFGRILARDDGVVAPMIAVSLAVLIAMGGLATDTAVWFAQQRSLQSVTDAAALAGARQASNPSAASATANAIITANGFDPVATVVAIQTGFYCPTAAQHFSTAQCAALPNVPVANAVLVTAHRTAQTFLLRALGTPGSRQPITISTVAVATQVNEAGLSAGTGTLSLNNGVANALLSSLTGSSVNLTVAQYNGLVNANLDALTFMNALATQVGVTAGTYDQLLQSKVTAGQILSAAASALGAQGQIADVNAVTGLASLQAALQGNPQINIGQLFDLGIWGGTQIGADNSPAALHAGLNLYQIASFALEIANGSNAVAIPTSTLGVPGLAGLSIAASAIEPPQSTFAFGPIGVSVHTAQVRLQLNLQVLPLVGNTGLVQVPLYVEVGSGTAQITNIQCTGNPATDAQVDVATSNGLASVYIGQAPSGLMTNFSQPIPASSIQMASIVGLPGLLNVQAKAVAQLAAGSDNLTFYQPGTSIQPNSTSGIIGAPPWSGSTGAQGVPALTTSSNLLSSLGTSLSKTLQVQLCLLGLCSPNSGALGSLIGVLNPLLGDVDGLLNPLLSALGINIGYMYTDVTGVRCGYPVLVY